MMKFKNKTMIFSVVLSLLLAGCGGGSGDGGAPTSSNSVTETVGSEGGVLELPDGSTVTIPPGAFSENVSVTFESKTGSTVPFNEFVEVLGKTLRITFSPPATTSSAVKQAPVRNLKEPLNLGFGDDPELTVFIPFNHAGSTPSMSCRSDFFNEQDVKVGGPTHSRIRLDPNGFGCVAPLLVGREIIEVNALSYDEYLKKKDTLDSQLVRRVLDNDLKAGCSPQDQSPKIPLILIHGWDDDIATATDLILENPQDGWDNFVNFLTGPRQCLNSDYEIFRFKYISTKHIDSNGLLLAEKINAEPILRNRTDIVIIGQSMGGLVARSYIVDHGGADKVNRLVTLATPHHGSLGPSRVSWVANAVKILDTDGARDMAWDNYDGVFKHGDRRTAGVTHPLIIFGKGCVTATEIKESSCATYLQKLNERDTHLAKYIYYGSAVFTNISFHASLNKHENAGSYKSVVESVDDGLVIGSPFGQKIRGYFIDGAVPLESALHICPNLECQTTVVPTTAGEALGKINAVLTPSRHRFIKDYDHTQMWQEVERSDERQDTPVIDELFQKIIGDLRKTITITKPGTGSGTVASTDGSINCGATCQASFTSGTDVTLSAISNAGSTFAGWTGGGCTGTGACTVTMNTDTTVTALFNLNTGLPAGSLDPTFGTGGKVTTDFGGTSHDVAKALVIQGDGKIVVAGMARSGGSAADNGAFALSRYNPDGTLDLTFGQGGKVTTDFGTIGGSETYALAIQRDGKIVAAGGNPESSFSGGVVDFYLSRYNLDGTLDLTFGQGGKVTTDFSDIIGSTSLDVANALVIQTDGKVVAGGRAGHNFALARYNLDGTLDTTFGSGGKILTGFDGGHGHSVYALVIQADGKIVAGGRASTISSLWPRRFGLARYNADGTLDITFGEGGKVTTRFSTGDEAKALALQADGKIVAAGNSSTGASGGVALSRYNTDGTLDISFGEGGKVGSGGFQAKALVIQADGKLVVAGPVFGVETNFGLARYNPDGTLDTAFGEGGWVKTNFDKGRGRGGPAEAIALQTDGKLVAAGGTGTDVSVGSDFGLTRYLP